MTIFCNYLQKLYSLGTCYFLLSVTSLGAKDTSFGKPRQASNTDESYIIAFTEESPQKTINFRRLKQELAAKGQPIFVEESYIKKFQPLVTLKALPKRVWRGFADEGLNGVREPAGLTLFELSFSHKEAAKKGLESLQKSSRFLFFEKDEQNFLQIKAESRRVSGKSLLERFYQVSFTWWQKQIKLPAFLALWEANQVLLQKKIKSPVVAILDSGLDYEHSCFSKENLWINPKVGQNDCGIDIYGCDTTKGSKKELGVSDIFPLGTQEASQICFNHKEFCSHGTQVASLISGQVVNSTNLGLCPSCQLLTLKVLGEDKGSPTLLDSSIIRALKYVALVSDKSQNPVRLINLSFGKYHKSKAVDLMLYYLRKEYNILTIAAAGNESSNKKFYPAASPHVLAVAASDQTEKLASYSNRGTWVNLVAPGGSSAYGMEVASPGGGLDYVKGTSMATPLVTGFAALLLTLEPNLTVDELESILLSTVNSQKIPLLDMEAGLKTLISQSYNQPQQKKRTIEPLCGQIMGISSSNKFHLKYMSLWFILLIPILFIILIKPHEVKL